MILGAHWNHDWCVNQFGRTADTYYVGNGVNTKDFAVEQTHKDGKIVLVEGWECTNPAKDVKHIGPEVAAKLRAKGYKIWAYSQLPIKTMPFVPDQYYQKPTLAQMNHMYSKASILLKATQYDARALAPMEAMTKSTPTVRAITLGDDDLIHNHNSLRCSYDEEPLLNNALKLLENEYERERFACNCIDHVEYYSWDFWMAYIKDILFKDNLGNLAKEQLYPASYV